MPPAPHRHHYRRGRHGPFPPPRRKTGTALRHCPQQPPLHRPDRRAIQTSPINNHRPIKPETRHPGNGPSGTATGTSACGDAVAADAPARNGSAMPSHRRKNSVLQPAMPTPLKSGTAPLAVQRRVGNTAEARTEPRQACGHWSTPQSRQHNTREVAGVSAPLDFSPAHDRYRSTARPPRNQRQSTAAAIMAPTRHRHRIPSTTTMPPLAATDATPSR